MLRITLFGAAIPIFLTLAIANAAPFTPGNVIVETVPGIGGSQPATLTEYTSCATFSLS